MDGYGLIASIIASVVSLGWPIAFFAAVWLFRKNLADLLPKLRVKHSDWEASFRLDRAEQEAQALPKQVSSPAPTPEELDHYSRIARISPRAAMLEIRAELEEAIEKLLERAGKVDKGRQLPLASAIRLLRAEKLIDAHSSSVLDGLRVVGNRVAHDRSASVDYEDAMQFKRLTDVVLANLDASPHKAEEKSS